MAESSDWISVSEAERLTGLSVRTIKRMATEGQITSARSPGHHIRVLRADVERLLRRESAAQVSASSVLQNKRERVEELSLQLQETRAARELRKLSEEDAEMERRRAEAKRVHELADKRALEETRLQTARDAERREREQREAEAQRQRAEFRRRWRRAARICRCQKSWRRGWVPIFCGTMAKLSCCSRTFGSQVFWQLVPFPEVVQGGKGFARISLAALTQKDQLIVGKLPVLFVVPFRF